MKTKPNFSYLLVGILSVMAASLRAEQDIITKVFDVKPGGKLVMKVDRGSIQINTTGSDKVDVKIAREVKRLSESEVRKVLETHKIEMTQDGDTIRIEAENPQQPRKLFGNNPFNRLQVNYTISVPAKFDLDLRTAGGNIDVPNVEGTVAVHTSGGNLNLGSIMGPIKGHTSGGNISLKGSKGNADLHTSGGDLRIGQVEGNLVAKTSGGNITLDKVTGRAEAQTSGGDVQVLEAYGPVMARTSGGNVSAKLNEQPKGDCSLTTSGGNVDLIIPENLAMDLKARTSGGSIRSDFPGTMSKDKTRLTAQLNGGGSEMVLETSGGNVSIRRK